MLTALFDVPVELLKPETPVLVPLLENVPSMMVPNVGLGLVAVVPDDVLEVVAVGSPFAGFVAGPVGVKGLAGGLGVSSDGVVAVCAKAGDAAASAATAMDTSSLFMLGFLLQQPPARGGNSGIRRRFPYERSRRGCGALSAIVCDGAHAAMRDRAPRVRRTVTQMSAA